MKIKIDDQGKEIIDKIIEQSRFLIEIKYWDNLTISKLNDWLKNFDTLEERYLSVMLLHRLIYRSRDAYSSMGKEIFHTKIPQILEDKGIYTIQTISEWLHDINSPKISRSLPFRFSSISNVDCRPVKSGAVIYNLLEDEFFDRQLGWHCDKYESLPDRIKAIILFDDIIGTGEQFENFYLERGLDKSELTIIYIPFAAVSNIYKNLELKYSNLIISPVEVIMENHSFFSSENRFLNKKECFTSEDFKELYLDFCRKKSIKVEDKLGKGELALTYVFNNSTPNNNLAILWHRDDGWNTLFKR
ncbi:phosphoribosyltransferase-like protein [Morganella morganii]|uniref:phosphoribosyltransferase-like protein n=1 Tax=Morganella morganii TaxID=582 RepID=UPI001BD9E331|nr:hypothetical protein [Morganella morganii]MBT0384038.1 hypothetical protein [Morganella morganii subsp. morganii]